MLFAVYRPASLMFRYSLVGVFVLRVVWRRGVSDEGALGASGLWWWGGGSVKETRPWQPAKRPSENLVINSRRSSLR